MSKLFAAAYDCLMHPLEARRFRDIRARLLADARGKVLDLGAGTGINFEHYDGVECVTAVEPDEHMRARSVARAAQARVPILLVGARAEALPFPDAAFDTAVATLVFCTIPAPSAAARELRRVLKPQGRLLAFEHVRLSHPALGRMQDFATPAWKRMCGGCHLNRDTVALLRENGFRVRHEAACMGALFTRIEAEPR